MPLRVRLTLAPLVLLVSAACGTSGAGGPPAIVEAEIEIEVDVMSGVPNPSWTVRGHDAATLADLINALPEDGEIDISSELNLGFRGFVLRGRDLPGDADHVRVLGTAVVVLPGHAVGMLRTDEDRTVYTMLRTMAEEHLDENVLQAIPVDGLKGS